jgi:hypothetical protein
MRVGIVGYGYIGRFIAERIAASGGRFETAFVYNRSAAALEGLDPALRLGDLADAESRRPGLIVECAHASISARYGKTFLQCADYMPLSVTALADDALRERLEAAAAAHGTRLLVPAGALTGGDDLLIAICELMAGEAMPEAERQDLRILAAEEGRVAVRIRPYATFETPPRHVYDPGDVKTLTHGYGASLPWDAD